MAMLRVSLCFILAAIPISVAAATTAQSLGALLKSARDTNCKG